jgi:hypothetical protein
LKSTTREDLNLGTCSSVGLLSNSQIRLTGLNIRTPVDTADSREVTEIDLGTQDTYRTFNSTLVINDQDERPQT